MSKISVNVPEFEKNEEVFVNKIFEVDKVKVFESRFSNITSNIDPKHINENLVSGVLDKLLDNLSIIAEKIGNAVNPKSLCIISSRNKSDKLSSRKPSTSLQRLILESMNVDEISQVALANQDTLRITCYCDFIPTYYWYQISFIA